MILNLSTTRRITTDKWNFIVEHARIAESGINAGKFAWKQKQFYPTLEMAVQSVYRRHTRDIDAEGCADVLKAIEALQGEVSELCKVYQT